MIRSILEPEAVGFDGWSSRAYKAREGSIKLKLVLHRGKGHFDKP